MPTPATCFHTGETLHLEHRYSPAGNALPSVYLHPDETPCKAIVMGQPTDDRSTPR